MIQLNYRDSRPIYEQIKESFRNLIVQEVMVRDEKLPSVRELATKLTINPNTIQRAYRELEQAGYVYSIPGKGSFVAGVPEKADGRIEELFEKLDEIIAELIYLDVSVEEIIERIKNVKQ